MSSLARRLRAAGLRSIVRIADRVMPISTALDRRAAVERSGAPTPVLVVGPPGGGFARYYSEILRNEGLTSVDEVEVDDLTDAVLDGRVVVIVGESVGGPEATALLSSWVERGGCLVAMRPDAALAALVGLAATVEAPVDGGYLIVDTSTPPGAGITESALQLHGPADRWELAGATAVAHLHAALGADRVGPAVTVRSVGAEGGMVAAFTFDLARSVVLTRQGNPAWAGQNRDGDGLIRSDDLFVGGKVDDPQPDWVDPALIRIPQADELQRLLINVVLWATSASLPLPRFWYLPHGKRAAVVMTGDDHGDGGTVARFEHYASLDPPGARVADWECVRATSYVFPKARIPWPKLVRFVRKGFEVAPHIATGGRDWTPDELRAYYDDQVRWLRNRLPFAGPPRTHRTHSVTWSDYVTQPHVELEHGIRLDTTYYFYPASWVAGRGGYFTGSALPMRFADLDGRPIDVYQAATQITDESAHLMPEVFEAMLDDAVGPTGFISVVTVNAHTDVVESGVSDAVVAASLARGVPVVSARQMLDWLDARNASVVDELAIDGDRLRFRVGAHPDARGLQLLVPFTRPDGGALHAVRRDGLDVAFSSETFKGVHYARVAALTGAYEAVYGGTMPALTMSEPVITVAGPARVDVRWTTSIPATTELQWGDGPEALTSSQVDDAPVTDHRAIVRDAAPGATLYLRARSVTPDDACAWPASGAAVDLRVPRTDVVHAGADLALGACDSVVFSPSGGGEVVLAPALHRTFDGGSLPDGRLSTPTVSQIGCEASVTFSPGTHQRFGVSTSDGGFGAFFQCDADDRLSATTWGGGDPATVPIPGAWSGRPHRFRIERWPEQAAFWINGDDVALAWAVVPADLTVCAEGLDGAPGPAVDWLRVLPYGGRGTYTSPVVDGGPGTVWGTIRWTATIAATCRLVCEVRGGESSTPSDDWTPWRPVDRSGADLGVTGRCVQYRFTLSRERGLRTPALRSVVLERRR